MASFKIVVAYDGTNYIGWQRQAAGTSIQGLLEDALRECEGCPVAVAGAGRTDAGVHALGQVASFSLERPFPPEVLLRALNARLPSDVRVIAAEHVAPDFHARFDATRKTYRYRIRHGRAISPFERFYAWHVPERLDVGAMDRAARLLEGRHDFAAFQTAGGPARTTERTVFQSRVIRCDASTSPQVAAPDAGDAPFQIPETGPLGPLFLYEITGDGFLRHMVRAIVGTLVEIGRGRWPSDRVRAILDSRDRREAGPTAPARGLFLVSVEFRDI